MSSRLRTRRAFVVLLTIALATLPVVPADAAHVDDSTVFSSDTCANAAARNCVKSLVKGSENGVGGAADSDLSVVGSYGDSGLTLQIQRSGGLDLIADVSIDTELTLVIRPDASVTPQAVVGTGLITDWSWNAGAHELTVIGFPRAASWAASCQPDACSGSAISDYDALFLLAVIDGEVTGLTAAQEAEFEAFLDDFDGGYIATNAQYFAAPTYNAAAEAVEFDLGAPHFETDGSTVNVGFFRILIPDKIITDRWLLDPDALDAADCSGDGTSSSLTVTKNGDEIAVGMTQTSDPAGWLFRNCDDFDYSTPEVAITPASVVEEEPDEFELTLGGGGPATTRLPVDLPETGEVTREITLQGQGATVEMAKGTLVTQGGTPFTGTIDPPRRVRGAPAGLSHAVSLTATAPASSAGVAGALAGADVVFDPPITITLSGAELETGSERVVRIAPDGTITDAAGTGTGRGVRFEATGLGTYGLASELDLAEIESAPSIRVALPIALPSDGVIDFPTTLEGDSASLAFAAGTVVTGTRGAVFAGSLEPPASATGPSGTGSVVEVATSDGTSVSFAPAATLALTPPEGTAASDAAPVRVTSAAATSCLTGTATADGAAMETAIASTGTFGLALPVTAAATPVARDWSVAAGFHSQWAGQSSAPSLCAGQVAELAVRLRNTGTETWSLGTTTQVLLGTSAPLGDTTDIDSGLVVAPLYGSRIATHAEATVAPGAVGTFNLRVRAPAEAGMHRIDVRPVVEGVSWLEDEGIYLELLVR